jgi:predicted metal-dependent enzyme (double-stranded beta helix superfamily)
VKLHDLCAAFEALSFPTDGDRAHPDRALVVAARASVEDAVVDDEFLADCFSTELRLIENNCLRRELTPFFTIPALGVRMAFGYWPPGGTPGPHEHTAWTIIAVCRNELEVLTYHRDESYRRGELVPKNRFSASAGRVGYIFDPCIHEPRNTSRDWSLSLHVSSPRDGEPPADRT